MALLPQVSYERIHAGLISFEQDLRAMGLNKAPGRLTRYIKDLNDLIEATHLQSWEPLGASPDHEQLVWSLVEGAELVGIHHGLKGYDEATLAQLYKKILKGPHKPSQESAKSSAARNTTFELHLGSCLRQSDIEIRLGGQADLWFRLPRTGAWVVVECKRLLSRSKLRTRIKEARKQVKKRLVKAPPRTVGVVAVSASKMINPGKNWLEVKTADLLERLESDLVKLHDAFASDFNSLPDPRIVGMIWHLTTPAWVKDQNVISTAQQHLVPLVNSLTHPEFPVAQVRELQQVIAVSLDA